MASISVREWGSIGTEQVMRIDLSQPNGMSVSCINYGARLIRLLVPDREGQSENVVLGLADAEAYGNDQASFGATVGPVAGRIAEGKWGAVQLEQNAGKHHIHGGSRGWGQQFWMRGDGAPLAAVAPGQKIAVSWHPAECHLFA